MTTPLRPSAERDAKLEPATGQVRMVLDTDAYNEVDDQFAIVQALLSPGRLAVEALYAAPFTNHLAATAERGMELSHDEILRVLERTKVAAPPVYRGSRRYLPDRRTPVESEAAFDLVERVLASRDRPLYVVAIGAPTNIAAALLLEPRIAEQCVVVWLGGHGLHWHTAHEFDLQQDPAAVRVLLESKVPLVLVPCMGVTSHLTTTVAELERYVAPCGEIGRFLVERFKQHEKAREGWAKEIWDMAAVGYVLDADWVPTTLQPTPGLNDDLTWRHGEHAHAARVAYFVDRNAVMKDFFDKLTDFARA